MSHTSSSQVQNTVQQETQSRDLDPNLRQRRASDPFSSVWVGASAGTGKTKVLSDRVLRLLLPKSKDISGTPPHKILCLTFTKAGASEMALRINNILAEWAILPETELHKKLDNLMGKAPEPYHMDAARKLFAQVIDTNGGIKIMTIHSFCQSVLGRFPLEAGIRPNFEVLDEGQTNDILNKAKDEVYAKALKQKTSPLTQSLQTLASTINEDQFLSLLKNMGSEKTQLRKLLGRNWDVEGLYTKLCAYLKIQPHGSTSSAIEEFCENIDEQSLRDVGRILYEATTKTDQSNGDALLRFLDLKKQDRIQNFESYKRIFLKADDQPRAKLIGKAISEAYPQYHNMLSQEQRRLLALQETIKKSECAALTRDLFTLGGAILEKYQALKDEQSVLDYNDLINKTMLLLGNQTSGTLSNMPGWVLYKLDEGLDHILVDEAQDTNPEQWSIVQSLCEEFFTTLKDKDDTLRTIFVVGDEKQSIYSFQRASPEEFDAMRSFFSRKIQETGHQWNNEALNISFRSTRSVLEAVDMVFAQDHLNNDPGFLDNRHISYRKGQAGLVELWPVFENEAAEELDPWEPPTRVIETRSGSSLCAEHIAVQIQSWVTSKDLLESHNRPIEAGDIMILVRTRTAFVNQLIRSLKIRNIPVSGYDRMVLDEQLAVQDLIALAEFALLPYDDLTLACLLKSPLIGLTEEQLYELAFNRKDSLWSALKEQEAHAKITQYLQSYIVSARSIRPYEFFAKALAKPCPADEKSGLKAFKSRLGEDCIDPIDELLNIALSFEESNIACLQYFLAWHQSGKSEIKRELEESGGQVRIMTVHGSKGLQAPIVIMPDTIRTSRHVPGQSDKRLLWPHKTGLDLPLWSPRKDMDFEEFSNAFSSIESRADEEYRRLLYVAMTRAEDLLYVTGYKGSKNPIDDCWYNYIQTAFENDPRVLKTENGILRLFNKQENDNDRQSSKKSKTIETDNVPTWLFEKAKKEPTPPQPLIPSRPSEIEPAASSPFNNKDQKIFKRGNLTHKLLQFLPDIDESKRHETACTFLNRYAPDLSEDVRDNIAQECLAILNDPIFKPLFGPSARAEVPMTGLIKNSELISGQIDRLMIGEDKIWIIDFKTNRPPPQNVENIPQIYQKQMQSYHDTLKEIYPSHEIICGLLWTDGPFLMQVDCT